MHGTLHFDTRYNPIGNYMFGVALTNNKRLKTKVEHQFIIQTNKSTGIL